MSSAFCIHQIVPGFVVYYLNLAITNSDVKLRFMYQKRPSESIQLPLDMGVLIDIPPRSPSNVPERIGMTSVRPGIAVLR